MTKKEKNTRGVLRLIHEFNFKDEDTASRYLQLKYIGAGTFRVAYRIAHTDMLIKFPDGHDGKVHTRAEVRKIRKLAAYPFLKKHLPPIYYFNSKTGVLVTRYYPDASRWHIANAMGDMLSLLLKKFTGIPFTDSWIGSDNFGLDRGRLILTDLGY